MELKRRCAARGLLILFFILPLRAQAVSVTPVAGGAFGGALVNTAAGYTTSYHTLMIGGGVLFEYYMSRSTSLELGGLYMPRGFVQSLPAGDAQITFTTVQVPLMLKVYAFRVFYVGIGGYFTYALGEIERSQGGVASTLPYNTLSFATNDYGAILNLGMQYPLAPRLSLALSARFMYGLPNINQSAGTVSLYDAQGLVGIKVDLNRIR
jgi:outer membrane protein W